MEKESRLFTPVLLIGCSIVLVGFAIRASFWRFPDTNSRRIWLAEI